MSQQPSSPARPTTRRWATLVVGATLVAGSCGGNSTESSTGATEAAASVTSTASDDTATQPTEGGESATGSTADRTASSSAPDSTSAAAAGDDDGVLKVPGEYDTIQAAVDAAASGDLVLIEAGTYQEAVDVTTDGVTIRGLDRDRVVLDGNFELDNGIRVLGASDVAVENLTTINYTANGLFWVGSEGYRASYITTYRTGDYGIYAFDSVRGQIDNSHTVGSRDAGVYIGQCYPCDAVIDQVVSSHNGIGYSGTNSGGNLLIVNSTFHNNRVGIVPNSGTYELCYPERETTIVGNLVYDNNQEDTAAIDVALLAQRNGILVAGGIDNVIERNRVDGHLRTGIGLVPFLEESPVDDLPTEDEWALSCDEQKELEIATVDGSLLWDSYDNVVRGNVVSNSGEADIAMASVGTPLAELRNCLSGNEAATFAPSALDELADCDNPADGDWADGDLGVARWLSEQSSLPAEVEWQDAPLPELGEHDDMPDAATAPATAATDAPIAVDLDAIAVPELP